MSALLLLLNINNGLGGSEPVSVLDLAAREFSKEAVIVVSLTVAGDIAGSQTFHFSPKDGRPLAARYGVDIRPYLLTFRGRPTRLKPDKALTERAKLTFTFADDLDAPDFDSGVFTVFEGGSFWRRLQVAQPDLIGSVIEVKLGYVTSGITFTDFRRIFKGRLEDIDFQPDQSVSVIAKDDAVFADRQVPAEIGDSNLLNGAVGAGTTALAVDDGEEITDPSSLDSADLLPVVMRLEPDTGNEEDVILNARSGDTLNVQGNFLDKSEEFDDAAWTKTATTVTADSGIGPFGGDARADLLALSIVGALVSQDTGEVATGLTFVFSIWLRLGPNTTTPGRITLEPILSDSSEAAPLSVTVTNDWQRFEISQAFTAGAGQTAAVRIRRAAGQLAEVQVYGAQMEKASARGFYAATDGNAGADAGRGAFGTAAIAHADDAIYKEAVPYRLHLDPESGLHPIVALHDLVNRGSVKVADTDQATFDGEFAFVESLQVKRDLSKPEKLSDIISELREQSLIDLWMGEDGLIKARFSWRQNVPGGNVKLISDEDNVLRGRSSYKGNAESRVTRVFVYYNLIAGTDGDKPEHFTNVEVVVDLAIEAASGQKAKPIFALWLFRASDAIAVAGRLLSRFKRGARIASFSADLKDEPDFFVGDVIQLDSNEFLGASGTEAVRAITQWQVVRKEVRRREGRVNFDGLQFGGLRYGIISPDNGLADPLSAFPDYPDADGTERQYGFIGDASNLVGTPTEDGYYIL